MNPFTRLALLISARSRTKRAELFQRQFRIDKNTRILDFGSEDGSNIHNVLAGCNYDPQNVYIADLDEASVATGRSKFGFHGVVIDETGKLPFADSSFDVVYCSSVIEHVTIKQADVWSATNGTDFKAQALRHQREFADEIRRVAKQYFVQTPSVSFPIESHTWLPFVGYLPRRAFVPLVRFCNSWWIKPSVPDFNLLNLRQMREMFPDAEIKTERIFGIAKSIMAIKVL